MMKNDEYALAKSLANIQIILVNPSHPGNIGATARAMKNMGLAQLTLVSPELFPHKEATVRASGADDILINAKICSSLAIALQDCHVTYALSARSRSFPWPSCTPRECAERIKQQFPSHQIGIVFGRENSGLTNDELTQCHYHVTIPSHPEFSSLNLAAAVQIMAYELWQQALLPSEKIFNGLSELETEMVDSKDSSIDSDLIQEKRALVTHQQMHGFFMHLEETLVKLGVIDPNHPKLLMQRLRRVFYRAELDHTELNILRGILTAVNRHVALK